MRNPINKVCIFGVLILAAAFWSCSTDSDVVTVGEDEYNGIHLVDDSIFDDEPAADEEDVKASSSSSKKIEKVSSSSKKSSASSSSKKQAKNSSSSKKSAVSSSSEKAPAESSAADSTTAKSSSSKKASSSSKEESSSSKIESSESVETKSSSSSARRIRPPGTEDNTPSKTSSSSKEESSTSKPESTPSEEVQPPSSSSVKGHSKDTTTVLTEKDKEENMEQLDSTEQSTIEQLIESGDTTIIKLDSMVVNPDTLDFDHNEYLCKAPDGTWHKLSKKKFLSWVEVILDVLSVWFTGKHLYDFTEVCDEMYIRPINR